MNWTRMETPIGPLGLVSNGDSLMQVILPGGEPKFEQLERHEDAILRQARSEIKQYFEGRRKVFGVPLCIDGTDFQEASWEALRAIPFGETRTYGDQAEAIGKPGAARAVGQANRRNPLPIIIPCHRVIGAGGSIGGYMGKWGERDSIKQHLLEMEQRHASAD